MLERASIVAIVRKLVAAGVPEHVRVDANWHLGGLTEALDEPVEAYGDSLWSTNVTRAHRGGRRRQGSFGVEGTRSILRGTYPQRCVLPHHRMAMFMLLTRSRHSVGVRAMKCKACGAELMVLTNVVRDAVPGAEHHTFICSACHTTERRVVFTRYGREDDREPVPIHEAPPTVPASKAQEKHSVAPGLFSRVVARIRGH
jgi:hypothetical protein